MSMEKSTYVILGYDLTNHETEKYDEWKWSKEWEDYTCNQVDGEIQLFDDCKDKLFLGYILAYTEGNEYIDPILYSIHDFEFEKKDMVIDKLSQLQEIGVIEDDSIFNPQYKLIVFDVSR